LTRLFKHVRSNASIRWWWDRRLQRARSFFTNSKRGTNNETCPTWKCKDCERGQRVCPGMRVRVYLFHNERISLTCMLVRPFTLFFTLVSLLNVIGVIKQQAIAANKKNVKPSMVKISYGRCNLLGLKITLRRWKYTCKSTERRPKLKDLHPMQKIRMMNLQT